MPDEYNIEIHDAWGIGNLRQTAGFPLGVKEKYHFVCPVGPLLVTWDIGKRCRVKTTQLVDDVITVLQKCKDTDLVLMISYSGSGFLLTSSLEPLCHFSIPANNIVYASWSACGKFFCVCNIGHFSSVRLYEVAGDGTSVTLKWTVGASETCSLEAQEPTSARINEGQEEAIHAMIDQSQVNQTTLQKADPAVTYYGCIFAGNQRILAIYKRHRSPCEAHLFTNDGVLLKRKPISPLGDPDTSMLCISQCREMKCAIGLQRGLFVFIDLDSLEVSSVFQAQGSAQVCIWDQGLLVTAAYQSGLLQWWDSHGNLRKEVATEKIESVVHLNWSVIGKEIWIGGITSLNYTFLGSVQNFDEEFSRTISMFDHTLAGCGLNFKDQMTLATGDLAGNVIVNELGKHPNIDMENKVNVKHSVRCLVWIDDGLFIGTLEGVLFHWQPYNQPEGKHEFNVVYNFDFGVLTLRKASRRKLFAAGTGGGDIFIFNAERTICELVAQFKVHACKAIAGGTGSQPMEIWSLAWDPSDKMIVTASEDQTSVVLNVNGGEHIAKITGHTSAVTSVDWKMLMNQACIVATCADDRTVRINDGKTFELLHILDTTEINGWFTYTYISINPMVNAVLCSSQNGFLVMWDLDSFNCLFCKKLHCGSIEGLEWNGISNKFATVGSDCIINVASFCDQASRSINEKASIPIPI